MSAQPADVYEVFRVEEVAALLRCSRRTVYRMVAQGQIRTFEVGKRKRVSRHELDRLIANGPVDEQVAQ